MKREDQPGYFVMVREFVRQAGGGLLYREFRTTLREVTQLKPHDMDHYSLYLKKKKRNMMHPTTLFEEARSHKHSRCIFHCTFRSRKDASACTMVIGPKPRSVKEA